MLSSALTGLTFLLSATLSTALTTTENSTHYTITNKALSLSVSKEIGHVVDIRLHDQDLLGPLNGNTGKGPYLDCSCTPDGFWTPSGNVEIVNGTDSSGTPYVGILMGDRYESTNQTLSQYLFLRGEETGLHAFSRATYFNEGGDAYLRDLGELRTLFRPNTDLWTHFSTSDGNYGPLPGRGLEGLTVQDATTYYGDSTDDPYVEEYSDYFTKYTLAESWRDHDVHGQFSDGSTSDTGDVFGAWLVHNTVESYYGGPLHSDLVVDGIVYNYLVSGHFGAPQPNLTHGFDRTWGPQYYYFNKGDKDTRLGELRADAARFADPEWSADFYDDIAEYIPNYVPSKKRTTFEGRVNMPKGAKRAIIVLSENEQDFQLNVFHPESKQYWADIDNGRFSIPRVVEGTYRVTIYADGIFGWFIEDNITVSKKSKKATFTWKEESSGKELWRIGTPDKSAGEYLHGYELDTSKPLEPEQYRIYWGTYDWISDFPDGVNFHIGESDEGKDLNYIHWSFFPAQGNQFLEENYYKNVNNWTITFDLKESQLRGTKKATFTVQIAGTRNANGNTKWVPDPNPLNNLPWTVNVNGVYEDTWVIPYYRSGSCGVRSGVQCQNTEHKFVFSADKLKKGRNEFVLSLPFNATSIETALLPDSLYVQYDALRLEVSMLSTRTKRSDGPNREWTTGERERLWRLKHEHPGLSRESFYRVFQHEFPDRSCGALYQEFQNMKKRKAAAERITVLKIGKRLGEVHHDALQLPPCKQQKVDDTEDEETSEDDGDIAFDGQIQPFAPSACLKRDTPTASPTDSESEDDDIDEIIYHLVQRIRASDKRERKSRKREEAMAARIKELELRLDQQEAKLADQAEEMKVIELAMDDQMFAGRANEEEMASMRREMDGLKKQLGEVFRVMTMDGSIWSPGVLAEKRGNIYNPVTTTSQGSSTKREHNWPAHFSN
ncbi:galactose mutarotase-like domain-containing protein [Aspergillus unguis]